MKKKIILTTLIAYFAMFFLTNLVFAEIENKAYWSYETLSRSVPVVLIGSIVNIIIIFTTKKK